MGAFLGKKIDFQGKGDGYAELHARRAGSGQVKRIFFTKRDGGPLYDGGRGPARVGHFPLSTKGFKLKILSLKLREKGGRRFVSLFL